MYEKCTKRLKEIELTEKKYKERLRKLPEGKILYSKYHNKVKWFQSNGSEPIYIPKSKIDKAGKLALRRQILLELEKLEIEKKSLELYSKQYIKFYQRNSSLLDENSPHNQLLATLYGTKEQKFKKWENEPYKRNTEFPEDLIHNTLKGDKVRSKSEQTIANLLRMNNIPYRYECELVINGETFFPDFTILHPKTGKIYYWEHLGIMDSPQYTKKNFRRLNIFADNSIIPSVNLILTFETKYNPLDPEVVLKLINEYFLD